MFVRKQGKTKKMYLPWTTGQIVGKGGLVAWSSGYLIPATSTTTPSTMAGVSTIAITAASDQYTTQGDIMVEVPVEQYVLWDALVTGTLVVADRGLYCDISDAVTVNRAASTYDVVQVIKYISTTHALVLLNIGPAGCGVIGA